MGVVLLAFSFYLIAHAATAPSVNWLSSEATAVNRVWDIATDSTGHVYSAGRMAASPFKLIISKYTPSLTNSAQTATYYFPTDPGGSNSWGTGVDYDGGGNVYATGFVNSETLVGKLTGLVWTKDYGVINQVSQNFVYRFVAVDRSNGLVYGIAKSGSQYILKKYNLSGSEILPVPTPYALTAPETFLAHVVTVGSDGSVYMGGQYFDGTTYRYAAVIKNKPDGSLDTSWGTNGMALVPASLDPYLVKTTLPGLAALEVAADSGGNVFLAINTENGSTNTYPILVKLNSSGQAVAINDYFGAGAGYTYPSQDLTLDSAGNVYLASVRQSPAGVDIIKYNNSLTTTLWNTTYSGGLSVQRPVSIAMLNGGTEDNFFVSGFVASGSKSVVGFGPVTVPTVTTQAASNPTLTSATLNGTITNTGGQNATVRGFQWGEDPTLSSGTVTTVENGSFGTGAFSSNVSTLTCGKTYYVRAYATNSAGTGRGSILQFGTNPCVNAPPSVSTQNTSPIAATAATLNGSIDNAGDATPSVRGFAWGTDSALKLGTATTTENGSFVVGPFSSAQSPLVCETAYYVRAYASNTYGTGYGTIKSFTTAACPTATLTVDSNQININTSTMLHWSSGNGATKCYFLGSPPNGISTGNAASGDVSTGPLTETTTYQLQCENASGTLSNVASQTVTVLDPHAYIIAVPNRVRSGGTSTISWSASQVTSCTLTATDDSGTTTLAWPFTIDPITLKLATTTHASDSLMKQTTYTISCNNAGATAEAKVVVNVPPEFQNF